MNFDQIPQELLIRAFETEIGERMALIPTDLPEPELSKRFQRKINRLKRYANRTKLMRTVILYTKKAAIIILTFLAVSTITVLSVDALREQLYRFIIERYEKFSQIYFEPTIPESVSVADSNFNPIFPSFIPDGFEQVNFINEKDLVMVEYEDNDQNLILYIQEPKSGSVTRKINTEGVTLEETRLNGRDAYFYTNRGVQTLLWEDDTCFYLVQTHLPKEILYQIAASLNRVGGYPLVE